MENTVIQQTFLKFDRSQKKQIFNKNPITSDKTEKPQIQWKKNQQWQHWIWCFTIKVDTVLAFGRITNKLVNTSVLANRNRAGLLHH